MLKKLFITFTFFILIAGCSGGDKSPVDSGLEDGIFHFGNGSEPQGIDPHIVTGVPEHHILISLCEGLTIANPDGGPNLPGVAESWTISDDGKEYIFYLNKNAKWSNGEVMTADDFVWSWMRILTASLGSQYPDMLYYLEGAEEYHTGKMTDFSEVGIKAIDDHTLKVNLKSPTPFFLGLLSHYSTWPVHKETVLKHGSIDDRTGQWTRPGNFVCNGPFQLKSWELNNKIVVEKNPHYWDAETVCGQIPAYSFTPPGSNGYYPDTELPFNPELAKQLMAEAGYSESNPFPKLEILFNTNEDHRKIALAIQQMWQENLGIQVELVNQDWKVYLSREMVGDFQVSRAGWIGDYEDPNTFLDLMRPNRGNNKTGWEDLEYDFVMQKANSTNNQEERYELLMEAERILIKNMPIIPLYTYVRAYQLSPDVKGYKPHILDHHHPKFIYLERD